MMLKNKTNKFLILIFFISLTIIISQDCPPNKPHLFSGRCYSSPNEYPTDVTCPNSYILGNKYTCNKFVTPEDIIVCPEDKKKCWDNSCVSNINDCPNEISCPDRMELRCIDNKCTSKKEICSKLINPECPNFLPVKCPRGGCRRRIEDCPQGFICPDDRPVLCNDYSCRKSKENCLEASMKTECPLNKFRCPDGTCVESIFLCSTLMTCPLNYIKCANGECAESIKRCKGLPVYKNIEDDKKVRCELTGELKTDLKDCPTGIICPFQKPVKCWDGSCKENINLCPAYKKCPLHMTECLDGSCSTNKECGTHITCNIDYPYKCQDNTCRKNPEDCPLFDDCPIERPIFCWDGKCYRSRDECTQIEKCKEPLTVRCPDFNCYTNYSSCKHSFNCPPGFFQQLNGACIKKELDESIYTDIQICPREFPIKCSDGLCLETNAYCNNKIIYSSTNPEKILCANGDEVDNTSQCKVVNRCPAGKYKCNDNSCEDTKDKCLFKKNTCPMNLPIRCENGSCKRSQVECLNTNGCLSKNKCSNGLCVENTDDCNKYDENVDNGCPISKPIKCNNEENIYKCVEKESECLICGKNKTYCKGLNKCVLNISDCKDGGNCPKDYIECSDGQCRKSIEECNNSFGCNLLTPFRCSDGECKKNKNYIQLFSKDNNDNETCKINIQCPSYKPFLCFDGSCEEKIEFCSSYNPESISNNPKNEIKLCPPSNPLLCDEKVNCMNSIVECKSAECMYPKPISCINSKCQDNSSECQLTSPSCKTFPIKEYMCYDGSCRTTSELCPLHKGCENLSFPFKCANGKCAKTHEDCSKYDNKLLQNDDRERLLVNTIYKPNELPLEFITICKNKVLCEDGICRESCPKFNGCPNSNPLLCSTGHCVKSFSECAAFSFCSLELPYRCGNGDCKKSISDCNNQYKINNINPIFLFNYHNYPLKADILMTSTNDITGYLSIKENTFYKKTGSDLKKSFIDIQLKVSTLQRAGLFNKTRVITHHTRRNDLKLSYPYSNSIKNNSLEFEYGVLSPVVKIELGSSLIPSSLVLVNRPIEISLAFNLDEINRKKGNGTYLDLFNDICLGKLNETENVFYCITNGEMRIKRDMEVYFLEEKIMSLGIYAVILSPKPNMKLVSLQSNIALEYFSVIIYSSSGFLGLIFIILYILNKINRFRMKYKFENKKKEMIDLKINEIQNIGCSNMGETIGDSLDKLIFTKNPCYKVDMKAIDGKRKGQLDTLEGDYLKKISMIESNIQKIDDELKKINNEIIRINEYKSNNKRS